MWSLLIKAPVSARELFWSVTALSFRETRAEKELATRVRITKNETMKERWKHGTN